MSKKLLLTIIIAAFIIAIAVITVLILTAKHPVMSQYKAPPLSEQNCAEHSPHDTICLN